MVRRRILLGLIVVVCALAGAWAGPRVAGPVTYETDLATLRFQLAVETAASASSSRWRTGACARPSTGLP